MEAHRPHALRSGAGSDVTLRSRTPHPQQFDPRFSSPRVPDPQASSAPRGATQPRDRYRDAQGRETLDCLPSEQSELVRLILWDGFTLPQAATILGIRESTARGRYQRARLRLRELLRPDEPSVSTPGSQREAGT
ncbi:sigma factor-like helix-turn-helix DNA-binding protein [Pseudoclavibacter helvolus]|uniref:sigma factor-like helix-turn-helix DNA-binding protein n=1 Tax=Pseudoclavibacter helvolus TaxID=255205 RepID=UPI003D15893C